MRLRSGLSRLPSERGSTPPLMLTTQSNYSPADEIQDTLTFGSMDHNSHLILIVHLPPWTPCQFGILHPRCGVYSPALRQKHQTPNQNLSEIYRRVGIDPMLYTNLNAEQFSNEAGSFSPTLWDLPKPAIICPLPCLASPSFWSRTGMAILMVSTTYADIEHILSCNLNAVLLAFWAANTTAGRTDSKAISPKLLDSKQWKGLTRVSMACCPFMSISTRLVSSGSTYKPASRTSNGTTNSKALMIHQGWRCLILPKSLYLTTIGKWMSKPTGSRWLTITMNATIAPHPTLLLLEFRTWQNIESTQRMDIWSITSSTNHRQTNNLGETSLSSTRQQVLQ